MFHFPLNKKIKHIRREKKKKRELIIRIQKRRAFRKLKQELDYFYCKRDTFYRLKKYKRNRICIRRDRLYQRLIKQFAILHLNMPPSILRWIYDP